MKRLILVIAVSLIVFSLPVFGQTGTQKLRLTVAKTGDGSGLITSSPPGIECGDQSNTCQALFAAGTSVTLTAKAMADGSAFIGWTGGNGSAAPCPASNEQCSFIMQADSTVVEIGRAHV